MLVTSHGIVASSLRMNLELMLNMLKIGPKHNTHVLKEQKILVVEEQQELVRDEAAAKPTVTSLNVWS
jgi:hypothetical protein